MGRPEELDFTVKEPLLPAAAPSSECDRDATRQCERLRRRRRILVWAGLALFAWAAWNSCDVDTVEDEFQAPACSPSEFAWDSIIPSENLEWTRCYQAPFECARLEVPLNYASPHGQKAAVAVIRYPSKYPVGHDKWRGPILYNPGGPGGSGVSMVRALAVNFSKIIGDDYDHVGFDPRGLGFTTPSLQLFPTDAESKMFAVASPTTLNSSSDALARAWGLSKLMGDLVEERTTAAWVAKHMSTALVARDMLSITRAYGREKLLYWGFSYGTVLGITYSAMFPDNVGRVIVDGVADTENYYSGAWDNNLRDTDAGLKLVLKSCASSSACPLYPGSSASAHAVRDRLDNIIASLNREPLVARNNATGNYALIDGHTAKSLLFGGLYKPIGGMIPALFAALVAAEKGDGLPLLNLSGQVDALWRCSSGNGNGGCGWTRGVNGAETHAAIACTDADVVRHESLGDITAFYENIAKTSQFADMWSTHTLCSGWKIRPVERYHGPFVGNTSFPVLFIGNTLDPVTPVWAARKMSKGFKDAVVLEQNSPGHCSLAASSLCTAKAIRAYFREGVVPKAHTMCETEDYIFKPDNGTSSLYDVKTMSVQDVELLNAVRDASQGFEVPMFGRHTMTT